MVMQPTESDHKPVDTKQAKQLRVNGLIMDLNWARVEH